MLIVGIKNVNKLLQTKKFQMKPKNAFCTKQSEREFKFKVKTAIATEY